MADQARDPFILMRHDGTFAYLNQKALFAWGYTAEAALQIRVPGVDPIYNEEKFAETFERAQRDTIPQFETLHKRKDGYIYPVEVNMGGFMFGEERLMFAVARVITERKKQRKRSGFPRIVCKKTFSIETVGVIYFNLEGVVHDANPAFENVSIFLPSSFFSACPAREFLVNLDSMCRVQTIVGRSQTIVLRFDDASHDADLSKHILFEPCTSA